VNSIRPRDTRRDLRDGCSSSLAPRDRLVDAPQLPRRGCRFPAGLYAIWFRVKPLPAGNLDATEQPTGSETPLSASLSVATSAVSQRAAE
jgi:hypothetical protein